jgi:hypothetical protein
MKRNSLTILSLVVLSLMFNITSVYAQSYAKAKVPFAFNVGTKQLPAGTYEIKLVGGADVIMIENNETRAAALSIARREGRGDTESKLVFDHVGDRYFLTEVWNSSDAGGMIVPTSRQEKALLKELQLAKGPSGDHVVIVALN